jgi:hypothetical protein
MPTTTTLSISISLDSTSSATDAPDWQSGTDVDSVVVPELSGSASSVIYAMETDDFNFVFDNYGYNSGSGAMGYYQTAGSFTGTLRVSGTSVILSGYSAIAARYGHATLTKTATAKVLVFGASKMELYADSGIALPQLSTLSPSGLISRVQYEMSQTVSGGKFSVKPIGNRLYRFR